MTSGIERSFPLSSLTEQGVESFLRVRVARTGPPARQGKGGGTQTRRNLPFAFSVQSPTLRALSRSFQARSLRLSLRHLAILAHATRRRRRSIPKTSRSKTENKTTTPSTPPAPSRCRSDPPTPLPRHRFVQPRPPLHVLAPVPSMPSPYRADIAFPSCSWVCRRVGARVLAGSTGRD